MPLETPALEEQARSLAAAERFAVLSTQLAERPQFPFGSLVGYALDADAQPVLLLSRLAVHTRNILAQPNASLCIQRGSSDPLDSPRLTLVGSCEPSADAAHREVYLAAHPDAEAWAAFADFGFWRLRVESAYFVAGFGAMGWIDAAAWQAALVDPLVPFAEGIVSHMNEDHADALPMYCRHFANLPTESARMVAVDRLGMEIRAETADGNRKLRIAFPAEANTPEAVRKTLVAMLREARGSSR